MPFTPEELAELARFDAEIDKEFELTEMELKQAQELDKEFAFDELGREKQEKIRKQKEYRKKHYKKNKQKILDREKKWRELHKEEIAVKRKQRYEANKEYYLEYQREYNKNYKEKHKMKIKAKNAEYYWNNRAEILRKNKERYKKGRRNKMKKIKDFLPEEHHCELNHLLEQEYQKCREAVEEFQCLDSEYSEKMDCHSGGVRRAIISINNFLDTETTAELEGVEPIIEHTQRCGVCDFVIMSQNDRWNYCPWCGQKIKWEGQDGP